MSPDRKLSLKDLDLPAEEVHELYNFLPALFHLATHDVRSPINGIAFNIEITLETLTKMQLKLQEGAGSDFEMLNDRLQKYRGYISSEMQRLDKQVSLLFGHFNRDEFFVANLADVVSAVTAVHKDVQLSTTPSSPDSLEILFPRNVLSAILSELVLNARRAIEKESIEKEPMIIIHWKMERFKFMLEVHDNGPGVILRDGLPVKTAGDPDWPKYIYGSGISLINKALYKIGGQISFARSRRAKGTVVRIQFPVKAYYLKGKGCEYAGRR